MKTACVLLSIIFMAILIPLPASADPTDQYIIRCETADGDCDSWAELTDSNAFIGGDAFQVNGYLKSYYTTPMVGFSESDTSKLWYTGVSSSEFFVSENGTSTKRLVIEAGGEVGIGTINPTFKLDVAGTGHFSDRLDVDDVNGTGWAAFLGDITSLSDFRGYGTIEIDDNNATKGTAGDWLGSSDQRLKRNVRPITGALEVITSLRGVEYEWINPEEHGVQSDAGFIAQDVELIFPSWVGEVEPKGLDRELIPAGEKAKGIGLPIAFEAYTVEAFRELSMEILALKEIVCADHPGAEICNQ